MSGQGSVLSKYTHLTTENGLPHEQVRRIVQDAERFIWIGTAHGLARFDGSSFECFYPGPDSLSIQDGKINDVIRTSKDEIWVATEGGVCRYNSISNNFTQFKNNANGNRSRAEVIHEDRSGLIWVGYERLPPSSGGASYLDPKTGVFTNIGEEFNAGIVWIEQDSEDDNIYWLGGLESMFKYDKNADQITPFSCTDCRNVKYVHYDGVQFKDELIIAHLTSGIIAFNKEDLSFQKVLDVKGVYNLTKVDNQFHLSSSRQGYGTWTENTQEVAFAPVKAGSSYGLPTSNVRCHFIDDKNRVWIGHEKGVSILDPAYAKFRIKQFNADDQKLMGVVSLRRVIHDAENKVVYGASSKGGLFCFDPVTLRLLRQIEFVTPEREKAPLIKDLIHTPEGVFGFTENYVFKIAEDESVIRLADLSFSNDSLRPSNRITYHSPEHICINTVNNNLLEINSTTGDVTRIEICSKPNERRNVIVGTHYDKEGNLWFSSLFARGYFDHTRQKPVLFEHQIAFGQSELPAVPHRSLPIGDSLIVYGSQMQGLLGFDIKNKNLFQLGTSHRYWLIRYVCDREGNIWAGTNKGLLKLNLATNEETWFGIEHGLPKSDMTTYGVHIDQENQIWLTSGEYLISFDPNQMDSTSPIEDCYIKRINLLSGESIDFRSQPKISLPWRNNGFQFEFAPVSFTNATQAQMEYRLEGMSDEWIQCGTQRQALFTNLQGGNYTLQIRETGQPQVLASMSIEVETAWYKTAWFLLTILCTSVLIVFVVVQRQVAKIKKESAAREAVSKRILDLRLTALRGQMNPHFLFNSLNSIKHYIIKSNTEQAADYITLFSSMMRQMLNHSRTEFISLKEEIEFIQLYLKMEHIRFEQEFEFEVNHDSVHDSSVIHIPPMLIQPFCENSIWHGLLHKKSDRKIRVCFTETVEGVQCTVEDNGIGIAAAKAMKANKTTTRKSHGMDIVDERISLLNDAHNLTASVQVEEIKENSIPAGTRVILNIPNYGKN